MRETWQWSPRHRRLEHSLARAATIGDAAGASGTLNLTSSSNLFNINGAHSAYWEFIVGRAGAGTLNVTGGARVTVTGSGGGSVMGVEAGSSGTATISGTNSLWSTFVTLRVGVDGQALLTVSDGGRVSAPAITVGTLGEVRGNGTLTGSVVNNGIVAPGTSPGQLSISGNFTQNVDAELRIEIASSSSFDILQAGGIVTLDGDVVVTLLDDFSPQIGDSFDILNWGSSFVDAGYSFILPTLNGALVWDISQFSTSGLISVIQSAVMLGGDYNGDDTVDAADYSVWRDSYGQVGTDLAADGTGSSAGIPDGVVDELDYDFWRLHFGEASGIGAVAASAAVPEPSIMVLAGIVFGVAAGLHARLGEESRERNFVSDTCIQGQGEHTTQCLKARHSKTEDQSMV